MSKRVVTLAHYYTAPEIQQMADKVGDSLELSLYARDAKADVIVFAGVRFMAETAKILNPQAEVILPDAGSTCSPLLFPLHFPPLPSQYPPGHPSPFPLLPVLSCWWSGTTKRSAWRRRRLV